MYFRRINKDAKLAEFESEWTELTTSLGRYEAVIESKDAEIERLRAEISAFATQSIQRPLVGRASSESGFFSQRRASVTQPVLVADSVLPSASTSS